MVGVNAIRARLQLALRAGTAAGAKLATPLKSHRGSFAAQTPRNAIAAGLREIRHVEGAAFRSVLNLVQYLRLFFLKARLARSPAEAKVEAVTFEVVSGLHGGVLLMLEPGEYQIGSTADADIVLRDPGVTPSHAMLAVRRGSVSLEATGGDVTIGHQTVSQGHGCRLKLPLEMSLGQASLRLAYLQSPRAAGLGGRYRLATAGIAACATIAIGLVTFLPGRQTADSAHAVTSESPVRLASSTSFASLDVPSPSEPDAGASRPTPPDQRPPSASSIDDAMQELTKKINAANIRTLRVNVADGRLAVDGSLSRRDNAAWSAIQHWFDQTYKGRLLLTTNFVANDGRATPLLQLQAVWFGDHPYVVTADGAHFYQGATLDNGWTIRGIDGERILLAKDGETVALTYR